MTLFVFPFEPIANGYTVQRLPTAKQVQRGAGLPNTRKSFKGGVFMVNMTFRLRSHQADLFNKVFDVDLDEGAQACEMQLKTRYSYKEAHEVIFQTGSLRGPRIEGTRHTFTVSAYARPIGARDSDYDDNLAELQAEYGNDLAAIFAALEDFSEHEVLTE